MSKKKPFFPTEETLFRHEVLSSVLALELMGMGRQQAVEAVTRMTFTDHRSRPTMVKERTIYRWLARFGHGDIEGLQREPRPPKEGSVLGEKLMKFIKEEREDDPYASLPELIRRARILGKVHPKAKIDRTTLWRQCKKLGIETRKRSVRITSEMRRYAYEHRMQMVLADFKHFRAGVGRHKRVALYFLDDATRFGLGVWVSTSENLEVVLYLLDWVVRHFGLMVILYLDRGSAFIAKDLHAVARKLGIIVIQGRERYPEGHGKIEKFNRGAKERVLASYNGNPEIDPDCGALTLRLRHDLHEIYNHLPHESLNKRSPHQEWTSSPRPLKMVQSEEELKEAFVLPLERLVSRDQVISYKSTLYEMPRGYGGTKVILERHLLEGDALYFQHRDRLIKLHEVDKVFNATCRQTAGRVEPEYPSSPMRCASTLDFERAFRPMTGPDGGYDHDDDDEE